MRTATTGAFATQRENSDRLRPHQSIRGYDLNLSAPSTRPTFAMVQNIRTTSYLAAGALPWWLYHFYLHLCALLQELAMVA